MRHRRYTPAERNQLVAAFRKSGLTQRQFADREGLNLSTLQVWLYGGRGGKRAVKTSEKPSFVRVETAAVETKAAAHIDFGNGIVLQFAELPDPAYIAELARAAAC